MPNYTILRSLNKGGLQVSQVLFFFAIITIVAVVLSFIVVKSIRMSVVAKMDGGDKRLSKENTYFEKN